MLLTACYSTESVCAPKEVVGDACDAVRGRPRGWADRSSGLAPSPWVADKPLMFPARPGRAPRDRPAAPSRTDKSDATTRTGRSSGTGSDHRSSQSDGCGHFQALSFADSSASLSADSCGPRWKQQHRREGLATSPGLSARPEPASWEQSCEDHRAKVSRVKELVRSVVGWGPQVGHLVDLRTGARKAVTFWLRDDVRALCIFDHEDTQVRVYSCGQMERCERLSTAPEVGARQFFLNLDDDALGCGLMIVMERSAHSTAVMHQGHLGIFRAQLALLCASRRQQQALLGAVQALTAELVLREIGSGARTHSSAFRQRGAAEPVPGQRGWRHLWPADSPAKSNRSSAGARARGWSEPPLPPRACTAR